MSSFVAIIDYGSGNLKSAQKALMVAAGQANNACEVIITSDPDQVRRADRLVLPGQGAFADCMTGLSSVPGMIEVLTERVIKQAVPFLGICVGMQLMATRGLEFGSHAGLGWIPGEVVKIVPDDPSLKIPHMGWNDVVIPSSAVHHPILQSIIEKTSETTLHFYFVHSFMFDCKEASHILAYAEYGQHVTAIIGRDNMMGTQFHPEKSQQNGLVLLSSFLNWKP
jgi:glutamine amidotransferase